MLISHPDKNGGKDITNGAKPLDEHLHAVATSAEKIAPEEIEDLAFYAGAFHDLGKSTEYFQQYVTGNHRQSLKTNHSRISALAAFYALEETHTLGERLLVWNVIHNHHKHLSNTTVTDTASKLHTNKHAQENSKILKDQVNSLKKQKEPITDCVDTVLASSPVSFDVIEFAEWVEEEEYTQIPSDYLAPYNIPSQNLPSIFSVSSVYSAVRAADLKDVKEYTDRDRQTITSESVTHYINNLEHETSLYDTTSFSPVKPVETTNTTVNSVPESLTVETIEETSSDQDVNKLRGIARREIQQNLRENPNENGYDIRLPTGLGKTLSALEAATTLRQLRDEQTGSSDNPPRIIYAMPQTAIIDQNHAVVSAAVADGIPESEQKEQSNTHDSCVINKNESPVTPRHVLKHHHLSEETHATTDITYDERHIEEYLTSKWDSEIITTTFVQLIESLVIPSKQQTARYEAFENAIILLDEIQMVPPKYWEILQKALQYFKDAYGWTVITMTATDPEITQDSHSLITSPDQYYEHVERVDYHITDSVHGDVWNPDETAAFVTSKVDGTTRDSVVVVCNTIAQAQTVYDAITGTEIAERGNVNVQFLSSNLPPCVRRERIRELSSSDGRGEKSIVVSTQVIEVGVDYSADCVIRELAPVDSMIQAAGRCNRNAERVSGDVFVTRTSVDGRSGLSKLIYGKTPVGQSQSILQSASTDNRLIPDSEMTTELLPAYYEALWSDRVQTNVGIDSMKSWDFETVAVELVETPVTVDVFIDTSSETRTLRRDYEQAVIDGDWSRVSELEPAFHDHVVSVNVYGGESNTAETIRELPDIADGEISGVKYLQTDNSEFESWYDQVTGLQTF